MASDPAPNRASSGAFEIIDENPTNAEAAAARQEAAAAPGANAAQQEQPRGGERTANASVAAGLVGLVTSALSASLELAGASGDFVDRIVEFGADVKVVDFYRQVSQIIPVLLLALAVERRVFEADALSRVDSPWWAVQVMAGAVLLAIVAAELLSLYAVATHEVEGYFFPVTTGALLMLLALLVAVALGSFRLRPAS